MADSVVLTNKRWVTSRDMHHEWERNVFKVTVGKPVYWSTYEVSLSYLKRIGSVKKTISKYKISLW
jgi:hypothetical protein